MNICRITEKKSRYGNIAGFFVLHILRELLPFILTNIYQTLIDLRTCLKISQYLDMKFPKLSQIYSCYKEFPLIITDSRKAVADSIFFALRGENFNGNAFADSALENGCSYAVIDDESFYKGERYILVKDVLRTLQELAKCHRTRFNIPFIAITGSNGKTTTKELIKSVLSKKYKTLATIGNLNNHIGVPLTILSITPDIEIAVIEMGANHMGEIALLCKIADPDYGIITNIGKAHIGEFGGFENIVKAKTELFNHIRRKNGKIFIHADNQLLLNNASGIEKITYGISENNFCQCEFLEANSYVKIKFYGNIISSNLVGKYNFENICAAICIGKFFGVSTTEIKKAIEEYIPANNRSQVVKTSRNILILDAYNANPNSMKAAIENFSEMKGNSKWIILGDMLELGQYEQEEHRNILHLIREKKLQNVILVGEKFSKAFSEIGELACIRVKNSHELIQKLQTEIKINNSLVLIKGSRSIKLEEAVEFL